MGLQHRKSNPCFAAPLSRFQECSSRTLPAALLSLGGIPQIYFDPLRDTLFIDHDSFPYDYSELHQHVEKHVLPSNLAEVRELALGMTEPYSSHGFGWANRGENG